MTPKLTVHKKCSSSIDSVKKTLPSLKTPWPELAAQHQAGLLTVADVFFAERMLASFPHSSSENALFLATLFASSREGHLCLLATDPRLQHGGETLPPQLKDTLIHQEAKRWYLKRNWQIESLFTKECQRLFAPPPRHTIPLDLLEHTLQALSLQELQKEAIRLAARACITLICGGPGTGKTYLATTLIKIFLEWLPASSILAAAPTGKATANLREKLSSLCEVLTLHAALKKKKCLSASLILIDESSMVDAETMMSLFSQVQTGARLILLGDPFQLPPVETGNFFADLIAASQRNEPCKGSYIELKKCLRTELQEIVAAAAAAKEGLPLPCEPLPDPRFLVDQLSRRFPLTARGSIEEILALYQKFRVLSPLREGCYGVKALNQQLFEIHCMLNSNPLIPIMIVENDGDKELFNGDVGLLSMNTKEAFFSGGKSFPSFLLPKFEWAYLLSVHKSQGSEYDEVLLLVPHGSERFGREVVYTAITRAKKKVAIWGEKEVLNQMLQKTTPRFSGLSLIDYI